MEKIMPIQYTINREEEIIEEYWTGTVTINDLRDYWRHYLAVPEVLNLRRTLVDMHEADIKFKGSELRSLVQAEVLPRLNGLDWKTAIVVLRPVQYGISRQYQVFAHSYSKDSIFFDYSEAKEWLLKL